MAPVLRTIRDQIAKLTLDHALDPYGEVKLEFEVSPNPPQRIDVWFIPRDLPSLERCPRYLRLLLRMACWPCQLEAFANTPNYFRVRQCTRKQHEVHYRLSQAKPPKLPEDNPPWVWIISPGQPRSAMMRLEARAAEGWPEGFYASAEGLALWFVVLSELPCTRETLILRMMGPAEMFDAALREINEIPEGDPDRGPLMNLVASLQFALQRDNTISQAEKEAFMSEVMAEFVRFKEDLRKEGVQLGEQRILLTIFEQRFGRPPEMVEKGLQVIKDEARLRHLVPLFLNGTPQDIAAALSGAQ